jgi:hypothetical protein
MQFINTLVPDDFRSMANKPQERFYLRATLSCVGTGLTLSLFVVYLHNIRHFSDSFATLLLALSELMLGLRHRLSAREDGTELVATDVELTLLRAMPDRRS